MGLKREVAAARARWEPLTLYQKFEHASILILTGLIAIVIALAIWNLALKILLNILSSTFDPTDHAVFQAVFGMIFTVIIALEFKRSLVVRKLIILDVSSTEPLQLFALAAAILALGGVYWLVRDQDRRRTRSPSAQ